MAPQQSPLTRFLYEARVTAEGVGEVIASNLHGDSSNATVELPPTVKGDEVADSIGSNVDKPAEPTMSSPSNFILQNERSTPVPVSVVEQVSDMQIVDPAVATPLHAATRQRHWPYEHNCHSQDSWAARLPWAESVLGRDSCVTQV